MKGGGGGGLVYKLGDSLYYKIFYKSVRICVIYLKHPPRSARLCLEVSE